MLTSEKLFNSQFGDSKITNLRLANFAEDCLNRFKTLAIEDQYATTIAELTIAIDNLRSNLSGVDTSLNKQKTRTLSLNQFIDEFKATIKIIEGLVAIRTGGRLSAIYLELYPHGIVEYTQANKTQLPILLDRISDVVTNHETALGVEVAGMLTNLKANWYTLRNDQEVLMTKVSDKRTSRDDAREAMELALHNAWHTVAMEFPMDVAKCERFFSFHLLYPVKHHTEEEGAETAKGKAVKVEGMKVDAMKVEAAKEDTANEAVVEEEAVKEGESTPQE